MPGDFAAIEQGLTELLAGLRGDFPADYAAEVSEFIEHAEYGLALETIVDILQEENISAGAPALKKILDLAERMKIQADIRERLAGLLPN